MKQLIRQAAVLIRQNPLFSVVSIVGTALTIAFVTVVVMIYDFRTSDIAPENRRSRLLYADAGQTSRPDGTNVNTGMGRVAYEALFNDLLGVEEHTWYAALGKSVCSLPASSERYNLLVRPSDGDGERSSPTPARRGTETGQGFRDKKTFPRGGREGF